ncbi:MAG: hypothetical protein HPZ89_03480, partial [Oscillospiraceae bacterium]|nr:hypothetical protein [Oscillospiraceae bacterium]
KRLESEKFDRNIRNVDFISIKSGAVIGEWLGAQSGLGCFSRRMMTQLDGAGVFAPTVLLSAVAMLLAAVAALVERAVIRWRGEL